MEGHGRSSGSGGEGRGNCRRGVAGLAGEVDEQGFVFFECGGKDGGSGSGGSKLEKREVGLWGMAGKAVWWCEQ
nr:hypothetical protein [Tanacetum cinerariifolium]